MKKPVKVIEMQKAQKEIAEKYAISFEKDRQEALKIWKAKQMGFGCS